MEHQFNLSIKSEILERQGDYLFQKAYDVLGKQATDTQVAALVDETIRRYYTNLGRPLLLERPAEPGHLPFIEDYNSIVEETAADLGILYSETETIGDYLSDYFNYAQSEKMRMQQRIRGITSLANDLNLIANDTTENSLYFRDSFDDATGIQADLIMGTPAQVATGEGIITLARTDTINRSTTAKIKTLQGNGEAGTYHLMRNARVTNADGKTVQSGLFISDQAANDDANAVLDGRPDTIFEYQMVNIPREDAVNVAKGYDLEWAKGTKTGDRLRLKLVIELETAEAINWLNVNPYHPPLSNGRLVVYSIRTSEDGFEYLPLYEEGRYIINAELNTTAQTYRADAIFDGKNSFTDSKFAGQGVWAFPTRKAKYVELVFDQPESYEEQIGHVYYEKTRRDENDNPIGRPLRIRSSEVPANIQESPIGTYNLDNTTDIEKAVEGFIGWRYAIGLRDVNVMSYQFAEKSEIVTTRYETPEPIRKIMLYANEKIPESYLAKIATANDWIQYFISIDDVNWHRISPMHHEPVSAEGFPPKIFEINGNKTDLAAAFQLHKSYLESDTPVHGVRLKAVLKRPADDEKENGMASTTPILEDYALRVILQDTHIQE